jgi:hypothetical protein
MYEGRQHTSGSSQADAAFQTLRSAHMGRLQTRSTSSGLPRNLTSSHSGGETAAQYRAATSSLRAARLRLSADDMRHRPAHPELLEQTAQFGAAVRALEYAETFRGSATLNLSRLALSATAHSERDSSERGRSSSSLPQQTTPGEDIDIPTPPHEDHRRGEGSPGSTSESCSDGCFEFQDTECTDNECYNCKTDACSPGAYTENFEWDLGYGDTGGCVDYSHLMVRAWCLLSENLDLIADAWRAYRSADDPRLDILLNLIGGEGYFDLLGPLDDWLEQWLDPDVFGFDVTMKVNLSCAYLNGLTAKQRGLNSVTIGKGYLDDLSKYWDEAGNYCRGFKEKWRQCISCDLAATLLHEITHMAFIGWLDGWDPTRDINRTSYKIENYFRYYLMKRYCVLGWGPCNFTNYGYDGDSTYKNLLGSSEDSLADNRRGSYTIQNESTMDYRLGTSWKDNFVCNTKPHQGSSGGSGGSSGSGIGGSLNLPPLSNTNVFKPVDQLVEVEDKISNPLDIRESEYDEWSGDELNHDKGELI